MKKIKIPKGNKGNKGIRVESGINNLSGHWLEDGSLAIAIGRVYAHLLVNSCYSTCSKCLILLLLKNKK